MKKQLLLLSLSLLLASCGGGTAGTSELESQAAGESQETTSQSTPAEESSAEPEKTRAQIAAELFTKMAETGNCTVTEASYSTTQYLGGDNGILMVYDSSVLSSDASYTGFGYAKLANYGIVRYYYVDDSTGVDASTTTVVSPNKNLAWDDFDNTAKELGECGKVVTFEESSRTHTLSTTDSDFMEALLAFNGNDADLDDYPTHKATITLDTTTLEMTVSYVLKGNSDTDTYPDQSVTGLVIGNIGTTKNAKVEAYLSSGVTLTAPSAWDSYTLSLFSYIDDTLTVPFPAGATYAASMPCESDSSTGGYLVFEDLGCGNIISTYGASLAAAGFAANADYTGTTTDYQMAGYSKTFVSTNPMEGDTTLTIALIYYPMSSYKTYYPNGIFEVYLFVETEAADITADQLNNYLAGFKLDWNSTTSAFPTFNLGTNYTKIEFYDETEEVEEYYNELYAQYASYYGYTSITFDFDIYSVIYVYYPTLTEAEAVMATIGTALVTAGYTESTNYENSYYLIDSTSTSDWEYDVDLEVATDDDGNYDGYLAIYCSAYLLTII